ncbi:MAG: hypothetical protein NDP13_05515 [Crenarchaeota archaeon]|nr:hypothetical protein [Thermoproteota archaeon]
MELLEALVVSFFATMSALTAHLILAKIRKWRGVKAYGPFLCAYKMDESGALKEVPVESIPKDIIEKFQQKATELQQELLNKFKPPEETMRRLHIVIFALIFYVSLVILLLSI